MTVRALPTKRNGTTREKRNLDYSCRGLGLLKTYFSKNKWSRLAFAQIVRGVFIQNKPGPPKLNILNSKKLRLIHAQKH